MKIFFSAILLFTLSINSYAQPSVDSVKATINMLFKAMNTSDPALLKTTFTVNPVLQTIQKDKSGIVKILSDSVSAFADAIGKAAKGSLDEQIVFDVVKVDADLATAWTPYKFFYNGKFSHCGVNSFQLVRINNVWKIQYLIDTRRRAGCEQ